MRPIEPLAMTTLPKDGCPRHRHRPSRACPDARCMASWSPEGAPSPDEQLTRWAAGDAVCPNSAHECCPDFGCCRPALGWDRATRARFVAAGPGEREKMMMGALGAFVEDEGAAVYVTRGDPADRG